jgi:hypothetical protein
VRAVLRAWRPSSAPPGPRSPSSRGRPAQASVPVRDPGYGGRRSRRRPGGPPGDRGRRSRHRPVRGSGYGGRRSRRPGAAPRWAVRPSHRQRPEKRPDSPGPPDPRGPPGPARRSAPGTRDRIRRGAGLVPETFAPSAAPHVARRTYATPDPDQRAALHTGSPVWGAPGRSAAGSTASQGSTGPAHALLRALAAPPDPVPPHCPVPEPPFPPRQAQEPAAPPPGPLAPPARVRGPAGSDSSGPSGSTGFPGPKSSPAGGRSADPRAARQPPRTRRCRRTNSRTTTWHRVRGGVPSRHCLADHRGEPRRSLHGTGVAARPQPVGQHPVSPLGEHRLGVELHTLHRQSPVPQPHGDTTR